MVKFKKLWLFERSKVQCFLNFIIAQCIAEIMAKLSSVRLENCKKENTESLIVFVACE